MYIRITMGCCTVIVAVISIIVLTIIMVVIFTPHRCFLDVLNAQISRGTKFKPFYAGVPGLPEPRAVIPELGALEDAFPIVQAEALDVFQSHLEARLGRGGKEIPRMDLTYNNIFLRSGFGDALSEKLCGPIMTVIYGTNTQIFDQIGSDGWRTFNLILYNQDVPENAEKCPTTVRLLKQIPTMQSALISIIAPGTYIPPHSDPAKGVIRYHLALKVPKKREKCFIVVDGLKYSWEEGKGVIFDDVYEHWVRNDTSEYRVILFVDILRPLKGASQALQSLANFANQYHPGVRRLIQKSRV